MILFYRGISESRREYSGLQSAHACKKKKHHDREMRREYDQEIPRRIPHYGLEQARDRDLVYVRPYHEINDDREG